MSGHSKWATTKRQKFAVDAKRGAAFTKVANMITIAAREGTDPEFNFKLRLAVEKARALSMPKENIERAIARGGGGAAAANMEEITYEAYGPGGAALLITAVCDNRMRAFTDIRSQITKNGGRMADAGAVSYLFDRKGVIIVKHTPEQAEEVQLAAIDAGADDVESEGDLTRVVTAMTDLQTVRHHLLEAGYEVPEAALSWIPKTPITLGNEDHAKLEKLLDALDSLDDVSDIATNI